MTVFKRSSDPAACLISNYREVSKNKIFNEFNQVIGLHTFES